MVSLHIPMLVPVCGHDLHTYAIYVVEYRVLILHASTHQLTKKHE